MEGNHHSPNHPRSIKRFAWFLVRGAISIAGEAEQTSPGTPKTRSRGAGQNRRGRRQELRSVSHSWRSIENIICNKRMMGWRSAEALGANQRPGFHTACGRRPVNPPWRAAGGFNQRRSVAKKRVLPSPTSMEYSRGEVLRCPTPVRNKNGTKKSNPRSVSV